MHCFRALIIAKTKMRGSGLQELVACIGALSGPGKKKQEAKKHKSSKSGLMHGYHNSRVIPRMDLCFMELSPSLAPKAYGVRALELNAR